MRWLVVALLCGCGPGSYDAFRDQYASRICKNARRCGRIGAADPCPVPASLPSAGPLDVSAAISDGKLRFDSDKAQDCLDRIENAPCNDAAFALRVYEHCHAVIGPNVPSGGACDDDVECVGGTCDGCRCVPYPVPGAACQPGDCDPTVQYCDSTCRPKKGEGSKCSTDEECDYPFFCAAGRCHHYPRTDDGKPCADPSAVCNDGSYCGPGGLCRPLHHKNEACEARGSCQPDNGCEAVDGGVCRPFSDVGQPCVDGLCPESQTCASDTDGGDADAGLPGACRADPSLPAGPLESCEQRSCSAGLYCAHDQLCHYEVLRGGRCTPDDSGCAAGLRCGKMSHRCESDAVCPSVDAGVPD